MAGRLTDTDVDVLQETGQKGRLADTDVEVLFPETKRGRLADLDVEVLFPETRRGRLTDLDVEVLLDDSASIQRIAIGPSGWGFIPIGSRIDRSVYIDDYEDDY